MKKFLAVFFFVPVFCIGQQKDFVIKGFLKTLPDGTEVQIKNEEIGADPLAKGVSKSGKFEIKGQITEPNLYYINFPGTSQRLYIFLDPSTITLNGHKDSLPVATVSGSASHNDFISFNKTFNPLFSELNPVVQALNSGKPDPTGATRRRYDELLMQINTAGDKFISDHKNSPVSPFTIMVLSQVAPDITVTENRFNQLTAQAKSGYFGKMDAQLIADAKVGAVGSQAIDFSQTDTSGTPVSLASFRGKYVLIDFWASWCGPCRNENPNVVEAFERFRSKNFTVLGVSLDRAREPWLQAIKDDNLKWTQVSDLKFWSNEVAQKYKVGGIPQNFLVDPKGVIVAKNLRGAELHQKLQELLQ